MVNLQRIYKQKYLLLCFEQVINLISRPLFSWHTYFMILNLNNVKLPTYLEFWTNSVGGSVLAKRGLNSTRFCSTDFSVALRVYGNSTYHEKALRKNLLLILG